MKFTGVSTYNRRPYILKEWVNRVQIKEIKEIINGKNVIMGHGPLLHEITPS